MYIRKHIHKAIIGLQENQHVLAIGMGRGQATSVAARKRKLPRRKTNDFDER